ncbi:60S ribosomal protein L7-like 1 [Sciurus carolinensis]|uniref:Large ribosomal subunit protein uL30 n=1 Tax=Sciurus carolinensis TaxID=30640 RepID=A0AA41MQP0_SCICA|nr:60S ribosomal protein L7-like 1 [Sciurus carolinensis]
MAEEEQRKKIPLVPENLLKKRKAYQALKATQAKQALLAKKERKGKQFRFKRLESFLHDSWWKKRDQKIFSGVFVKVTPKSLKMLRIVEPYMTWGFPNLKSVQELTLKRGQAKIKNKTIPLTDNTVIEEHLGRFDVICLEDLIHEIAFPGKYFWEISRFFCPFHLSVARHATKNRVGFLKEMGLPGYQGERINQLICQLN